MSLPRPHLATCALVALVATCTAFAAHARSHPPLTTKRGVVAADHPDAAKVGARVLSAGGNAADAAAATALAAGVLQPASSGIGGGGFAVVYVAKERTVYVLDFREVAPAGLTPDKFVRNGTVDTQLSAVGGLAVGVPGEVAGLEQLVQRFGRRPFAKAVAPAEQLARTGFDVGWFLARGASFFGAPDRIPDDPWFARWLIRGGQPIAEGDRVKRPKLARTLGEIRKRGAAGFYTGWVARDIVERVRATGGVMTMQDLAAYRVHERKPLWGAWRGKRVATMPLPSSGGLILLAALGVLDATGVDLAKLGSGSSAAHHVVAEVLKHSFADRARVLGDVGHSRMSTAEFLAPERLARVARQISRFGVIDHADYGDATLGAAAGTRDDAGTSHICVVDADGNAVALTTTVNLSFGAKIVGATSGIVLNNEIDDFSLASGVPNAFGLVQADANLVGPGKRPLSSMSPTLVLDNDRVVACVGGSGGPLIISNVIQVLLNLYVHGMDAREAVDAPRVHHQWLPDKLFVEAEVPRDVVALLAARGHALQSGWSSISAVQAIIVRAGTREAASDPRKGGAPAAASR